MDSIRIIKPEFFLDDRLAELSPLERLAFIGMWTIANDEGTIWNRPKRLKAQILPYDDCDFESIVNNLAKERFIAFFGGEAEDMFISIIDFEFHQNLQQECGAENNG
jgi:hypothetical protein